MIVRFALRGGGLALKFLLALAITQFLGFQAMAIYGMAIAVSVISSKMMGLGFSIEVNRRIGAGECGLEVPIRTLKMTTLVAGITGVAVALIAPLKWESLSYMTAALLAATAVTEYVSYEINTLVFSAHKPQAGTLLIFGRTGAWALLASIGLWFGLIDRIEHVLALWIVANLFVSAAGARVLFRSIEVRPQAVQLRALLATGMLFYVATAVIATTQYLDRFLLAAFAMPEDLGRYVYAWSMANVVQTLTFAVVSVVAIPDLARRLRDETRWTGPSEIFANTWVARSLALSGVLYVGFLVVLMGARSLSTDITLPDLHLSAIIGAAFVAKSAADVVLGGMIATRRGPAALTAALTTLLLSVALYALVIPAHGVTGAAWGFLLSSLVSLPVIYTAARLFDKRRFPR